MKTVVSVLFVLFVLPTVCTIALADAVPGALLYLDARDNRAHPTAWTNHGTVGGELSGAGNSPELEEGTIAIPALGIDTISRFYTHRKPGQCWGGKGDGLKIFNKETPIEVVVIRANAIWISALNGAALIQPQNSQSSSFDPSGWLDEVKTLCLSDDDPLIQRSEFSSCCQLFAIADAVPGALPWTNHGTVGEAPAIDIDTRSVLGRQRRRPQTISRNELLLRMNSRDSHRAGLRNQIAGFQPQKLEGDNAIRISFWWEPGEIGGQFGGARDNLLLLKEDVWTWINFVSGATIKLYKDGRVRNLMEGAKFNKETPIEVVVLGANSYGERAQNFNGSIALVRVYDRALSTAEIKQNITAWAEWRSVDPASKLTTTWGGVKARY